MKKREFVVGLDIGTTKICAMVGCRGEAGEVEIMGMGITPSKGLRKGVVVNLESTIDSIERAIEKAESAAGLEVSHVFTGIAGGHIKGLNSRRSEEHTSIYLVCRLLLEKKEHTS